MAGIAIIVGHAWKDTYCEALGEAYRRGAEAGGHKATLFVTSKMTFDPILHEGSTEIQPLEHDLQMAYNAIMEADHLAFIFRFGLEPSPPFSRGFLSACCSQISWSLPKKASSQKSSKVSQPAS